ESTHYSGIKSTETTSIERRIMAVGINIERGGAEIAWEPGDYVGPVTIKAVNAENGDVGIVRDENDGRHFLTWPPGSWTDHVTVFEGDTDVVVDEGDVAVVVGD